MTSFIQAFSSHEIVTSPYLFFKANYPCNRIHLTAVCHQTWDEIIFAWHDVDSFGSDEVVIAGFLGVRLL
jgi:hypothetical protein